MRRLLGSAALVLGLAVLSACNPPDKSGAPKANGDTGSAPANTFADEIAGTGLDTFTHTDGSSGRKFFPEQMGSGVALFDYDNDGWLDVYFCSGSPLPGYKGPKPSNRLFRNTQDGKFEDVTEKAGVAANRFSIGVACGDFDNDGNMDLYVCCFGANILYRNNGDGTFDDVTKAAGVGESRLSSSAAWGDYDNDGYLDLYVANYVKYTLAIDRFCSKFAGLKSYCGPNLYDPDVDTLYHNNGNGTFTDVSDKSGIRKEAGNGLGVVWLDYNEDGKQDLFVANDQSRNVLMRNNGNGTFTDVALEMGVAFGEQGNAQAGMGVDTGDFDNDGKVDILVTNFSEETNALYHNTGSLYRDISYQSGMGPPTLMRLGFGTAFLDYDRDGLLDMFFANGHVLDDIEKYSDAVTWPQANMLFRNKGDLTFEDVSDATKLGSAKQVGRGSAVGDLFNTGHPDIVVNVLRGKPLLYRDRYGDNNHWLQLTLKAAWGNPQGIGAKVWLTAGGKTQRRDVKTCGSFASSSDVRPLFGLGSADKVEMLKIRWPSGKEQTVAVDAVDKNLLVEEGK